ncbi:MAG: phosphoribosylglycinamide formyltransferase [Eubacteriaceae bacterium]|nr:phosphoribosylglycinamide formyltransferase [Eubacteriaceae bacterium]
MARKRDRARIAVFVSGGGTNLQALIDAQKTGQIPNGRIVLVVSNKKDAYALTRAKEAGIPALTITKKQCGSAEAFEEALKEAVKEYMVDLIVLAGFLAILSENFTKDYPERIINIHPSLIPSFCGEGYYGLRVHEEALARGVKVTGATVHYVNEIPDGGEIIIQKAVNINNKDTAESLQRKVMEQAEWKILPEAVQKVAKIITKSRQG